MSGTDEFWNPKRPRPASWFPSILYFILCLAGLGLMVSYGTASRGLRMHMQPFAFGPLFLVGRTVVTLIHELGHGIMAFAVGFRFASVQMGPLAIHKLPNGKLDITFNWNRLFQEGGYWGALPISELHVRSNMILVVIGGPLASLITGLSIWSLVLQSPGAYWDSFALISALFLADFVANLVPVGYSDGTMLLHLTLWTRRGKDLVAMVLAAIPAIESNRKLWRGDYQSEVELRLQALEKLKLASPPAADLAQAYLHLGFAQINARLTTEAVQSLNQSLELLKSSAGKTPALGHSLLEANVWLGLYKIHMSAQRTSETKAAWEAAVKAFEIAKTNHPEERAAIHMALADLHAGQENFQIAIREAGEALAATPDNDKNRFSRSRILKVLATCQFHLGQPTSADHSIDEATRLLDSSELSEIDRTRAASQLASLGTALWLAGRSEGAESLLEKSAQRLEALGEGEEAAACQIQRATVLRKMGKIGEAESALPAEDRVQGRRRLALLTERGEVRQRSGQLDAALADFEQALALALGLGLEATALATLQSSIAEVLIEMGRLPEAAALARKAEEVLAAAGHPNRAGALVTLALTVNERHQESALRSFSEAFRIVDESPLLGVATKARALESMAERLELHGHSELAKTWRTTAAAHWRDLSIGVHPEAVNR